MHRTACQSGVVSRSAIYSDSTNGRRATVSSVAVVTLIEFIIDAVIFLLYKEASDKHVHRTSACTVEISLI